MAMALAAYVGTMVAALIALVVAWQSVIGPPALDKVRQQPRPVFAFTQQQQTTPAKPQGAWGPPVVHTADDSANVASADDAQLAAAKAAAEKAKRLKQARYQKRKEQLARQRQDQQNQDQQFALGYDQERQASSAQPLNLFAPRRF